MLGAASPDIILNPAVTRAQLDEVDQYDTNMVSWEAVDLFFEGISEGDLPLDITDGERFPWWVFLANTGERSQAAGSGVNKVYIVRNNAVEGNPLTFLILRDDDMVRLHRKKSLKSIAGVGEYNRLMGIR